MNFNKITRWIVSILLATTLTHIGYSPLLNSQEMFINAPLTFCVIGYLICLFLLLVWAILKILE